MSRREERAVRLIRSVTWDLHYRAEKISGPDLPDLRPVSDFTRLPRAREWVRRQLDLYPLGTTFRIAVQQGKGDNYFCPLETHKLESVSRPPGIGQPQSGDRLES